MDLVDDHGERLWVFGVEPGGECLPLHEECQACQVKVVALESYCSGETRLVEAEQRSDSPTIVEGNFAILPLITSRTQTHHQTD